MTPQHTLTYKPLGKKKKTIVNVNYENATVAPFKKPRPRSRGMGKTTSEGEDICIEKRQG